MHNNYLHHVSDVSIFEWSEVSLWGSQTTKPIHTASTQDETVLQYFYKDLNLKAQ